MKNRKGRGDNVTKRYWIFPVFLPNIGCPHRCAFCDQRAVTGQEGSLPEIQDLNDCFEKVRFSGKQAKDAFLTRQIAFFGGNFTAIPRSIQKRYLDWASDKVARGYVNSIRFSTRPDALGEHEFVFLKNYPVGTVEVGVQSLNDEVLRKVERGHTSLDCERAVARVVRQGWEAGVQLMPGLPGETLESFLSGVERVSQWTVRYVRLYPAVVLKETRLAEDYAQGVYTPLTLEKAITWCARACDILEARGIEVIRMGLPASERLQESVVAGPYHPAFGFLVQSSRFHRVLWHKIRKLPKSSHRIKIFLAPADIPLLMGDRRKSWNFLRAAYPDREFSYEPNPRLERGQVKLMS